MTNIRQFIPLFAFLIIFLAACSPVLTENPQPTAILSAPTLPPGNTPDAEPEPVNAPVENDPVCTAPGVVERYQIESEVLNSQLFISVYLPPCYDASREEGYPTLYLLHGQTFNDRMWIELGAPEIVDRLVLSGNALPFMIVMPYEEFYYRDVEANQFPEALTVEVIPWIEKNFDVCEGMACRALGGISRGASWAMRIGLTEPGIFSSIGGHSLPTFSGDISRLPGWLDSIPARQMPRIYIDTGRFDPEVKAAYRFENILNENGIPHTWLLNDGRHNEEYWSAHIEDYLRWYAEGWENLE
jgi:enterochelin esterase-like enzyme